MISKGSEYCLHAERAGRARAHARAAAVTPIDGYRRPRAFIPHDGVFRTASFAVDTYDLPPRQAPALIDTRQPEPRLAGRYPYGFRTSVYAISAEVAPGVVEAQIRGSGLRVFLRMKVDKRRFTGLSTGLIAVYAGATPYDRRQPRWARSPRLFQPPSGLAPGPGQQVAAQESAACSVRW